MYIYIYMYTYIYIYLQIFETDCIVNTEGEKQVLGGWRVMGGGVSVFMDCDHHVVNKYRGDIYVFLFHIHIHIYIYIYIHIIHIYIYTVYRYLISLKQIWNSSMVFPILRKMFCLLQDD